MTATALRWLRTLRSGDTVRWASADAEVHPGLFTGWVDVRVDMWGLRGSHLVTVIDPCDPVPAPGQVLELAPEVGVSGRFVDFELYDTAETGQVTAPSLSDGVVTVPAWTPAAVSSALTRWAVEESGLLVCFEFDADAMPRPRLDMAPLALPAVDADAVVLG